jgi:phosphate transport system substrate-binding protein
MRMKSFAIALGACVTLTNSALAIDVSLPAYRVVAGVSGQLKSVGSDTLHQEISLWAEGFKSKYPNVRIDVEGKGSATAPPALLSGDAQFGPMSRFMTSAEIDAFEKKYGYKPTAIRVAVDALAIYVNKDNSVPCLTLQQLDQIFSSTRKGSGSKSIDKWGEVGLSGEWSEQPIAMHGRNQISGTHEFFKQLVLYSGEFKEAVKQEVGSEAVVDAVAKNRFAIGYSGIGYKTSGVRAVPVAAYYGAKCYETSAEDTYGGKYPIARYLYVYVNKKPNEALDSLRVEFLKYILSKDGQIQTEKGGYYPITSEIREAELNRLGLSDSTK